MKARRNFIAKMLLVQLLVWLQRAVRLLLRGCWLGVGELLGYWGLSRLIGVPLDFRYATAWIVLIALITLVSIFFPWPRFERLTWSMDRRLGSKEQLTTAWQVVRKREDGEIPDLLIGDAAKLLGPIWLHLTWRGWRLGRDLLAALVVVLLFSVVYFAQQAPAQVHLSTDEIALLPPTGEDPKALDIFPSGILGLDEPPIGSTAMQQSLSPEQLNSLRTTLQDLGKELAQNVMTYDLGQSLQQQDFNQAASNFEELSSTLPTLSQESLKQIGSALENAGDNLSEDRVQPLALDMQSAASDLESENNQAAGDQMDALAQDMRDLNEMLAAAGNQGVGDKMSSGDKPGAGEGAGVSDSVRSQGQTQPLERIEGGDQVVQLGEFGPGEDQVLPGQQNQGTGGPSSGDTLSRLESRDIDFSNSFLTPYSYSWIWRNVVSEYFAK